MISASTPGKGKEEDEAQRRCSACAGLVWREVFLGLASTKAQITSVQQPFAEKGLNVWG